MHTEKLAQMTLIGIFLSSAFSDSRFSVPSLSPMIIAKPAIRKPINSGITFKRIFGSSSLSRITSNTVR